MTDSGLEQRRAGGDRRPVPHQPGRRSVGGSFEWKFVNYTPLLVGGALIILWIAWHANVKKWFTGPKITLDK